MEVKRKINYNHWTDGGTLITNFNIENFGMFERAIQEYDNSENPCLILSKTAYSKSGYILENQGSLHLMDDRDLSFFWRIFDNIRATKRYSVKEFKGYTYRYIVQLFKKGGPLPSNKNIFSNDNNTGSIAEHLSSKLANTDYSFAIIHKSTREQDESDSIFIDEILKDL